MNRSCKELFGSKKEIDLTREIIILPDITDEIYRCKVIYSKEIDKIEWTKYAAKNIKRLKTVKADDVEYFHKYLDRSIFEKLRMENNCSTNEDILIVKNGRITDTSFSNVGLFNGKEWLTPKFPLLKGTKRSKLIKEKKIIEKDILLQDLTDYERIVLINAMLEFDTKKSYSIKNFII